MDISEQIKDIKKSFRLYMNGVAASSMRKKGLDYKVNWGISQVDLRNIASGYAKDEELAHALWSEKSRECRLLATMIMPFDKMELSVAEIWANEINSTEIAEAIAFNLFQHIKQAEQLAANMLGGKRLQRMAAYHLTCRLLKRGVCCEQSTYDELFNHASADLNSSDRQLMHSAVNCLDFIAFSGEKQSLKAEQLLKEAGFDC